MPRWTVLLGLAAIFVGLLAIVVPIGFNLSSEILRKQAEVQVLESRVEKLESLIKSTHITMEVPDPKLFHPPNENAVSPTILKERDQ